MTVTRRKFLVGTGATLSGAWLGCGSGSRVDPEVYDLCIVGSGFAGVYLGLAAIRKRLQTVIVEAGTDPSNPEPGVIPLAPEFLFTNRGEIVYPVNATRAIALGGASNHWGGVANRLWPEELRMRSRYGTAIDWPLEYEELRPYYCKAEDLLRVRGFPYVAGAEPPRACGYPNERKDQAYRAPDIPIEGVELPWASVPRSRPTTRKPVRLIDQEIPKFQHSRYGTLLRNRQVSRLVTLDGRRIDHVETLGGDGMPLGIRARYFVIAAGVVESVRLLLLSRSRWYPKGIGNTHDLVGRYFGAHPGIGSRYESLRDRNLPRGEHRTYGLSDRYRKAGLNGCHFQLDVHSPLRIRWRVHPGMEPRAENRIRLSAVERDRFGNSLPEVSLSYSERDQATLDRCRKTLADLRQGFGVLEGTLEEWDRWRAHPSGGCRMGAEQDSGVVDIHNRVFGLDNLYVSGASTFPFPGTPNPTETVVALTLRLADHLIDQLRPEKGESAG